ncbi:MAG: hypothetical protein ACI9GW_001971 [Halieaceae bacterium]|jgi:hypothetical protein
MSNGRGVLTRVVQDVAMVQLGREITPRELRLMPYIQYCMMNNQRIDPNRVNSEERDILQSWRQLGYIEGGAGGLSITKEFWDQINQILWQAYVDYRADPQ